MGLDLNGAPKQYPGIAIGWDQENQSVHLDFDPQQFKQWTFIMSILDMAKEKCRQAMMQQQVMQMGQAQAEAAQAEAIRRSLRGN